MTEFARVRHALAELGFTPAAAVPEASEGRSEEAGIHPAVLTEDDRLEWHAPGAPESWPGAVAFLDGVQHLELLGYVGASPLFAGRLAAAVRERGDRRLRTATVERRRVAIGRPAALQAAAAALAELEPLPIPDDEPPHPVRDAHAAGRALDRARGQLEVAVGGRWRSRADGWLVVDGSLAESPAWSADRRMVGVVKSHASLPFDGPDLERYLRLPAGQRTSVFVPASRSVAPVRAWALRLWPWEGRDLLYGLVRIEVAPPNGEPYSADRISRWLLAERAPISAPDRRWDRLLYGIHDVEA
ncbi:MAG TPA: hypothetical protein VFK09_02575, partial [Gemmatimonadales bacterium]|nr:hypothetical protein [Gemmatimonadales bacterium]